MGENLTLGALCSLCLSWHASAPNQTFPPKFVLSAIASATAEGLAQRLSEAEIALLLGVKNGLTFGRK